MDIYYEESQLIDCKKHMSEGNEPVAVHTGGSQMPPVIVNHELVHRFVCSNVWDKVGMSSTWYSTLRY